MYASFVEIIIHGQGFEEEGCEDVLAIQYV